MALREDYQGLMQKRLEEWKAQSDRMKTDAEKLEAQTKAQFDRNLALMRAKQDEAWEKFHEMKKAGETAWEHLKAGMEKAAEDVKAAAERASQHFKK